MRTGKGKHIAIFLILLVGASCIDLIAHDMANDTLKNRLEPFNDSIKLVELKKAARSYEKSSLIKGLSVAGIRKDLAIKIGDPIMIADNFNLIGNLYLESGMWDKAEENYNLSFNIYDSLGYQDGIATETHNMGLRR